MNEQVFLDNCKEQNYSGTDVSKFKKALDFSKKRLSSKKRLAGDSFFDHYLRAAVILVESKSAPEIITSAILQGLPRYEIEIRYIFGDEIINLLKSLETLKKLKIKNNQLESEALRKIILTTLEDVRVILIKLANKLDNLHYINILPIDEQQHIAEEVLEIYAPLAYRLGVEKIRTRLEDASLKILNPRKFQEIATFLEESSEQREKNVESVISLIKDITNKEVAIKSVKGRSKHIYSIYKKIVNKGIKLNDMYDFLGVRVIVEEVKDCYTLLGLLHEKFNPIEGRLKDYIANPKSNFYRSIHTAVNINGKIIEIQIRTPEMDEFAEEGIAAHWRYKGVKSEESFEKKISWLRSVLDLHKDSKNKDFLETVKVDIFGDNIYCYTPNGDVKELPLGATLIDFAYLVHEEIGNHVVGGRVNGKFVPLKHQLVLGDVVEVLTNKHQRPRRSWIKIVKSAKTRQKIRRSLKEHEQLPALHYRLLKPVVKEEQGVLTSSEEFPTAVCTFAKCCLALPGESIVGIFTKRKIISVHKEECRAALKEQNRWIPVQWRTTFNQKISFFIQAEERSGVLADLLHTIATAGFEVKEAKAKLIGAGNAECSFLVIPKDLEQVKMLVNRVEKVKGVRKIYFE